MRPKDIKNLLPLTSLGRQMALKDFSEITRQRQMIQDRIAAVQRVAEGGGEILGPETFAFEIHGGGQRIEIWRQSKMRKLTAELLQLDDGLAAAKQVAAKAVGRHEVIQKMVTSTHKSRG